MSCMKTMVMPLQFSLDDIQTKMKRHDMAHKEAQS